MRLPTCAPLLLLLSACGQAPSPVAPPAPGARTGDISSGDAQGLSPMPALGRGRPTASLPTPPLRAEGHSRVEPPGSLSTPDVEQVVATLELSGVAGPHQVVAEFIAPSGEPYGHQALQLAGHPSEVLTADFALPVKGTHITQHALTGTWTTRFLLDGQPVAESTFVLPE